MVRRWRWWRLLSRIVVVLRVESGVHNAARRLPCGLCLRARLSLSLSLTEPKPGLGRYVVGHGDGALLSEQPAAQALLSSSDGDLT